MNKRIYVDNAATTKLDPKVLADMIPYFSENFGNPSTIYNEGRFARSSIDNARKQAALSIGANPSEIYFTASGTESDNWAILSTAAMKKSKGNHIITSAVEHHAVLNACKKLEKDGFSVTYLPVDEYGRVSPEDVKSAITDQTILITIMLANNEIGSVMPIAEIGKIAKEHKIIFHTDAVQAIGAIPVNVDELNVDMLSLSGHKFHGPKGVGALYVRKGTPLTTLMFGGAQESNRRPGTENVPAIVGLGKALELADQNISAVSEKCKTLRDALIKKVLDTIPYTRLNGHPIHRLPGNVNFSFDFIEGESLLLMLDMKGISASSGSACTSGSLDPSHVLLAIGLKHETAHGSLRITFSEENTLEDVDYIVKTLTDVVQKLRDMSPLYEQVRQQSSF